MGRLFVVRPFNDEPIDESIEFKARLSKTTKVSDITFQ